MGKYLKKENNIFSCHNVQANFLYSCAIPLTGLYEFDCAQVA